MKSTKLACFAALALAGMAYLPSANATVPIPADGDLFMGFHSAVASNEYLVDIGQFSLFDSKPVGFHLSLGNYSADLTTVFGSGWSTDAGVLWGAVGQLTIGTANTLFATKAKPSDGTFGQAWQRQSSSAQNFSASQIQTMEFTDYFGQQETPNNPGGTIHDKTGNSWAFNNPGSVSFQTWVPTVEAGGAGGISNNRLDLFRIDPSTTGEFSQYIGTFSIDATGNVSYDVLAAVPEPSTYASLLGGAVLLFALRRFVSNRSLKV